MRLCLQVSWPGVWRVEAITSLLSWDFFISSFPSTDCHVCAACGLELSHLEPGVLVKFHLPSPGPCDGWFYVSIM